MGTPRSTVYAVRIRGGWLGTMAGSGAQIEADSWHGLRVRAAEHEGAGLEEIRLVPQIPRTPLSQEVLEAAEAIMNQPFPSFDPDGTVGVIDLPRPAAFIFHAIAALNSDGTFTITIPGLSGMEVTVTDPEDGPDSLARVMEHEWGREPDTIIVVVHTDAEAETPPRGLEA